MNFLKRIYITFIRPLLGNQLNQQRFKLILAYGWQYFKVFNFRLPVKEKIYIVKKMYEIDFFILSGHSAKEMLNIIKYTCQRERKGTEVFVEAGCWNGGSTAKFSVLCDLFGYKLHVYDSFEGVEQTDDELAFFGGKYAAPEELVKDNVSKYGKIDVVTFHKGWFKDTFKKLTFDDPVGLVYIDCDLKTGTIEVLEGLKKNFSTNAYIFSQDFHISPIKKLLEDRSFWERLGLQITSLHLTKKLALFKVHE